MILKSKIKQQRTYLFRAVFLHAAWISLCFFIAGCIYKFNEAGTIKPNVKTVKLNIIENKAQYVNNQISQRLTERLRQKMNSQTRLSQTNSDSADWEISGAITDYSLSTSAISNQQVATNRLTVAVHMSRNDRKNDDVKEYDVSRSFEFRANQSLQQAETTLMDEMIRTLVDEIFNKLFSDW